MFQIQPTYESLSFRIIDALTGDLLPSTSWQDPERNEQRVAIAVCDATSMTPGYWSRLSKDERVPWLHKTLTHLKKRPKPNEWLEGDDLPTYCPDQQEQQEEDAQTPAPANAREADAADTPTPAKRRKRSTEKGEGRAKIIAALNKHHQYDNGSCGNSAHIGNNELARIAGVSESTASVFFRDNFKGHNRYMAACADPPTLAASLKLLNQEFSPHHLFGRMPPDEDDRDADE